jgi:hypothetical protein
MIDLREALHEQAATSRPRPDVDDVMARSEARRKRRAQRRVVTALLVVLAVSGVGVALSRGDGGADRGISVAGATGGLPGLRIGDARTSTLDRRDLGVDDGPWTVIVRRSDGSLARHGAVVTWPVATMPTGTEVTINGETGRRAPGEIVWPVAGSPGYARVRGDLSDDELLALAQRTYVVRGGRPAVRATPGLSTVFSGPYRAPVVREARYGSAQLGEDKALGGGLTYTGVLRAGGFEDQLYATADRTSLRVGGKPAVVSAVQGGNATLAWELAPGRIAYVGYSGNSISDAAAQALARLARRTRLVPPRAWAATHPGVSEQPNDFGS